MKYFKESEFLMDGSQVFDKMDADFLKALDFVRESADVPFKINSSYRSPAKNRAVGGSPGSMHLLGRAVDIEARTGEIRAKIVDAALAYGLTVGIMENAIHIDNRENQILFHYYAKYKKK